MTKIIIADDHEIVRQGLKRIIEDAPDFIVVDEAKNGNELIAKVQKNDYDIVILDISMPGNSGLDTLQKIKSLKPNLKVLILSVHSEKQYAVRVLKDGASGFINKESEQDELLRALRTVSRGEKYISDKLANKLALDFFKDFNKPQHEKLSNREFQVLCQIAEGKSLSQIADELNLGKKTIGTYRYRILEKMELKNNVEIAHYAIKNNLI